MHGLLTVITGPMFAGKTSELQKHILWDVHRKAPIIVYKPRFDDRYHETKIVTHDGVSIDAIQISSVSEITIQNTTKTVYFDEAQFFVEPVFYGDFIGAVETLLRCGVNVTVSGISSDWQGKPFTIMADLLARADHIVKITALCSVCGQPATKTFKKIQDGQSVVLGAGDLYEARCTQHWHAEHVAVYKLLMYKSDDRWFFDDPVRGLMKEEMVCGADDALTLMANGREEITIKFSNREFNGYEIKLTIDSTYTTNDFGEFGTFYDSSLGIKMWLCPSLLKYFNPAPQNLWISIE